jgi:predicted nucleotide-binding protein
MVAFSNAGSGWRRLSRQAQHIASEEEFIQDSGAKPVQKHEGVEVSGKDAVTMTKADIGSDSATLSRKVFIVHGHDEGARETVARFLERVDFEPIILHEQASRGCTVIEKIENHGEVDFAVVILTPDDEGYEKGGKPRPRARQNVVLELGYFVARLGRERVCALKRGDNLELPSDFGGVVYVPFDDSGGWKQALGKELEAAGFTIDWGKAMSGGRR